jgi:hypothetical protein
VKPEKIHGLVEAVHHWLSFQILCGREALLSESYLNQPTGEYLLHAAGSSHLKTEHDHPILNTQGKRGSLPLVKTDCLAEQQTGDHPAQEHQMAFVADRAVLTQ